MPSSTITILLVKERGTVIVEGESKRYAKERDREFIETLWRACKRAHVYI